MQGFFIDLYILRTIMDYGRQEERGRSMRKEAEIMTLSEVAQYLKLAEKTIHRLIKKNEIPCVKVASQWRFMKTMIDDWLISRMKVVPQNDLSRLIESGKDIVPLSRITDENLILTDMTAGSREDILKQLTYVLFAEGIIDDKEFFIKKLIEREEMVSTAIGNGIAIPHLRNPKDNSCKRPAMVVGICKEGSDFLSPDGEKTHLFFLISSDSEIVHLRILSTLNRMLSRDDICSLFKEAKTKKDVLEIFIKHEKPGGEK